MMTNYIIKETVISKYLLSNDNNMEYVFLAVLLVGVVQLIKYGR